MTGTPVGVIDGHPLYRAALARLVAEAPDLDLCVASGSVAHFVAGRRCVNCLVLLDLGLPRVNGVAAVRAVTGLGHRVLALSAEASREEVRAVLAAGAVGYLGKHAEAEEILAAVREVAAGSRFVSTVLVNAPVSNGLELSERELEVLRCLATGERDEDIARRLRISIRTVRSYLDRIRDKTGLRRRSALTRYAIEQGLIVPAGYSPA
ncbi:LuxR C-terminal-related transcriptional regulator [Actinophytocola oryzae]|uniref:LuxR family two component transcriptional regulator n=1 Tax=Actinophytocola oryzae TaxID=502181 RepID=A0A4R7VY54_9PSEU|nr:response regulator transcription factor [Actinophytocola oryzae]TDV54994.1 LuxR family two component transcriptional regulator [Actinophytocola oryzae]